MTDSTPDVPSVYLAFTPLHLLRSILHALGSPGEKHLVLQVYTRHLHGFYRRVATRLEAAGVFRTVSVVKRNRFVDATGLARLHDERVCRALPRGFHLVNFAWQPDHLSIYSAVYFRHAGSATFVEDAPMVRHAVPEQGLRRLLKRVYGIPFDIVDSPKVHGFYLTDPQAYPSAFAAKAAPIVEFADLASAGPAVTDRLFEWFEVPAAGTVRDRGALVLTQPISTAPGYRRSDQRRLHEALVASRADVVVKRHPRDDLPYAFDGQVPEIPRHVPFELLELQGQTWREIISISSSAGHGGATAQRHLLAPEGIKRLTRAQLHEALDRFLTVPVDPSRDPEPGSVSVCAVILHYRDWSRTETCLRTLRAGGYRGSVLVVDNGSDGAAPSWLRAPELGPLDLLPLPENRGFQGGMNAGMRWALAAGADVVVLVNNDVAFTGNSVDQFAATLMAHPELGGTSAVNCDETGRPVTGRKVPRRLMRVFPAYREDHTMTFACAALTRECLEEVGLLDERFFMYWGDLEYRARMRRHGFRPAADPAASVTHPGGGSRPADDLPRRGELTAGLALYSRQRGWTWVAGALLQTGIAMAVAVASTRSLGSAATLARSFRWGLRIDQPAWQVLAEAPWQARRQDRPGPQSRSGPGASRARATTKSVTS